MNTLDKDHAAGRLQRATPPCLSIYLPTHRHHPDNQQDPIRFGNLVKELERSLLREHTAAAARTLLEPFERLAQDRDFWNCTLDGLAVLGARDFFRTYVLQRTVPELAIVAQSFHTKPLLRILQSADRYQVLAVNRKAIRLFEGNRDHLAEIEPARGVPITLVEALGAELTEPHLTVASYGGAGGQQSPMHHGHGGKDSEVDGDAERFFRAVDRAVLEHHSQPSGLPLILAALPEHHHRFHQVSHNPHLLPQSLDVHPDALSSLDELRERAWKLFEPRYLERLAGWLEDFGNAKAQGRADDDPERVAQAVVQGRVERLMLDDQRRLPGRLDAATGELSLDELEHPEVDDVLDDLGEATLAHGGKVVIVPSDRMPTQTGVAAIHRYREA